MSNSNVLRFFIVIYLGFATGTPAFSAKSMSHTAHALPECSATSVASLRCASAPSAAFDHKGQLWLAWAFGGHVYLSVSGDHGRSFSKPNVVNRVPENIVANGENRPKIALDKNGNIYISWTKQLARRFTGDIRFSHSRDGGKSFESPITVNDDQQLITHRFDALSVSANGVVHIAWLDKRDRHRAHKNDDEYHGAALYYATMGRGATQFTPNRKIVDHTCECCRVAIDIDQNEIPIIMWRHIYGENTRDHALVKLSQSGESQDVRRVSYDNWQIDACPHHGPSLSVGRNNIYHSVWFNNAPKSHGLFYAHTKNDGQTFTKPLSFGDLNRSAAHPFVLAEKNKVVIVWKEFDGEQTHIMKISSQDNGVSWDQATPIAATRGSSDHPLLVSNKKQVFLSWQTGNEGYRLLAIASI